METNETSKHGLSAFEEEVENWTFVNPEDARAQELSDESSDHGSDSGSSIVVIDSQPQQQHLENLMDSQEHSDEDEDISIVAMKEEQLITEGVTASLFPHQQPAQLEEWNSVLDCRELQELSVLDDPENGMEISSTQQPNEFVREKSPYVVVEYSNPLDSEVLKNTEMYHAEDEKSNDEEGISTLLPDFHTAAYNDLEYSEEAANQDCLLSVAPSTLDIEENVMDHVPVAATHSQALLSARDVESGESIIGLFDINESADELNKSINTTEEIAIFHPGSVFITGTDNEEEGIVDPENEAEIDTINTVDGDEEKLKKEEDWSSESSDDEELDEEAWDLSLGALLNSGSMTSSLSSLIQEPSSPSPIIPVPSIARIVKPDLLEEANRIEEMDQLDYSAESNPDLPPELNIANIFRDRHYVHHPNQRLNLTLTYIVAFAMAAVVGFALGHVIGLSDNFPSRCPFPSGRIFSGDAHLSDGWSKEQWRSEVQRLTALNREMNQALRNQHAEDSNSCRFDFHVNDLLTENWDLKQSIGRIRYGKPTRSLEDRDTINRLETENQDLRNTVGKLRYQCGQPSLIPLPQQDLLNGIKMKAPESVVSETMLKTLDAMNLTQFWSSLMEDDDELMDGLRASAVDLISLIGLRREELNNLTKENTNSATERMQVTLKKSVEKVIQLMERIHNHQGATAALADEVEIRLKELRTKIEDGWIKVFETESNAAEGRSKIPENRETSLNADWFISMGQHREELRRNEQQAHWLFERAKERERERKNSRKYQPKTKKQKVFQGNSWSHYSA